MVDENNGRICSVCKELLLIDEFRFKNRRKDKKHLICFDCEPEGGFGATTLIDPLVARLATEKEKLDSFNNAEAKEILHRMANGKEDLEKAKDTMRGRRIKENAGNIIQHFLMLASSCEDIAKQIEIATRAIKTRPDVKASELNKKAKTAAKKIGEAIKLLS